MSARKPHGSVAFPAPNGVVPNVVIGLWSDHRARERSRAKPGTLFYHPVRRAAWIGGRKLDLSPRRAQVLFAIVSRYPGYSSKGEIIDHLWGHDPLGGPLRALALISSDLHSLRPTAAKLNLSIRSTRSHGFIAKSEAEVDAGAHA